MPIIDSRVRNGTLTLDAVAFECQARTITITPSHTQEDGVETLCGESTAPALTTQWALNITAIQDFTDAAGFVNATWENNGTSVPFTWCPGDEDVEPTFSGTVQVRAVELGGEVAAQLTTDAEFPIVGVPTRTEPTPPLTV